jgi:hypothetical protein
LLKLEKKQIKPVALMLSRVFRETGKTSFLIQKREE